MTDSRSLNALIGAVVTLVLSFTVFSPVIGGAVAAWLEEGDKTASVQVGGLSGIIALIPLFVIFLGIFSGLAGFTAAILFVVFGTAFLTIFVVALSALGGYLAHYVMKDRRISGTKE